MIPNTIPTPTKLFNKLSWQKGENYFIRKTLGLLSHAFAKDLGIVTNDPTLWTVINRNPVKRFLSHFRSNFESLSPLLDSIHCSCIFRKEVF
jgi:hypothetical protein